MENLLDLNRMLKSTSDLMFSHLLTVGDFNFKEINWSLCESSGNEGHMSSIFLEGIKDCFLFQHIREPTRFREGQIPSILDLTFANEENIVDKINYLPSLGESDHIISIIRCFNFTCFTEKPIKTYKKYNFNKGTYISRINHLSAIDWSFMQDLNLTESWKYFAELFVDLIERFIPVSKVPSDTLKPKSYLTQQCREAIKTKHRKWGENTVKQIRILVHIKRQEIKLCLI